MIRYAELVERLEANADADRDHGFRARAETAEEAAQAIRTLTKERDMAVEALRASLPVMERELNHLLESCCLLDKETLEPIRETLEGGVSDVVLDMEDGIAKARAVLTQLEASKGEG